MLIMVKQDGDSYFAYDADTFVNLQESMAAFGDTPDEAIEAFIEELSKE